MCCHRHGISSPLLFSHSLPPPTHNATRVNRVSRRHRVWSRRPRCLPPSRRRLLTDALQMWPTRSSISVIRKWSVPPHPPPHKVIVMRCLLLQFAFDSTSIQRAFGVHSTACQRSLRSPACCTAALLEQYMFILIVVAVQFVIAFIKPILCLCLCLCL